MRNYIDVTNFNHYSNNAQLKQIPQIGYNQNVILKQRIINKGIDLNTSFKSLSTASIGQKTTVILTLYYLMEKNH